MADDAAGEVRIADAALARRVKEPVMKTTVVNVRTDRYDVYIGRAGRGCDGSFGNPHPLHREAERELVIEKFRQYFFARVQHDAEFRQKVLALKGKRLACFCKPARACHGDVIAEWVDAQG